MTPRRITALVCVVAIALLLLGAFSKRWFVADLRTPDINGSLRIGLTSVSACMATAEISACQQLAWSQVHGLQGVHVEGSSWMWLGRITFGLALLACVALAGLAAVATLGLDVRLPLPLPKLVQWSCVALLLFMGGYWALTPNAFSAIAAGRGFAFVGLGAVAGIVAAFRDSERDDF